MQVLVILLFFQTLKNIFPEVAVRASTIPETINDNCTTSIETECYERKKEAPPKVTNLSGGKVNNVGTSSDVITAECYDSIKHRNSNCMASVVDSVKTVSIDEYSTITALLASPSSSEQTTVKSISYRWDFLISNIKDRIRLFISTVQGLWHRVVFNIRSRLLFFLRSKNDGATNGQQQKGFSPSFTYSAAQPGNREILGFIRPYSVTTVLYCTVLMYALN